jgi:hypothetical protein
MVLLDRPGLLPTPKKAGVHKLQCSGICHAVAIIVQFLLPTGVLHLVEDVDEKAITVLAPLLRSDQRFDCGAVWSACEYGASLGYLFRSD